MKTAKEYIIEQSKSNPLIKGMETNTALIELLDEYATQFTSQQKPDGWIDKKDGHSFLNRKDTPYSADAMKEGYTPFYFSPQPQQKTEQDIEKSAENIKDLVLEEYKKGNIVVAGIEGIQAMPLKEFVKQPTEGILYDLNRNEMVVLTFIKDKKWINDYAVAKVIGELKSQLDEVLLAQQQPGNIDWDEIFTKG